MCGISICSSYEIITLSSRNQTRPNQSKENRNPHAIKLAQQAVVSCEAPLVVEVVLAEGEDVSTTTTPVEAAVTSSPYTSPTVPPTLKVTD